HLGQQSYPQGTDFCVPITSARGGSASDKTARPGSRFISTLKKNSLSRWYRRTRARKHPPPHVQRREARWCNGPRPLLKQMSYARQIDRAAPAQLELFLVP